MRILLYIAILILSSSCSEQTGSGVTDIGKAFPAGGGINDILGFDNINLSWSISTINDGNGSRLIGYFDRGEELEITKYFINSGSNNGQYNVTGYHALSNQGVYVEVTEPHYNRDGVFIPATDYDRYKYYVSGIASDGFPYYPIKSAGDYVGESTNQVIVFSNGEIYDTATNVLSRLDYTDSANITVESLSGNFTVIAVRDGNSKYQVYDLRTSLKYDLSGDPDSSSASDDVAIQALSETTLLVQDAQSGNNFMNMTDGSRTNAFSDDIGLYATYRASDYTNSGAFIIDSFSLNGVPCSAALTFACLYFVDELGMTSLVTNKTFKIISSRAEETIIFPSKNHIVVQGESGLDVVVRSSGSSFRVLNNSVVHSIDITPTHERFFFTSTDNTGSSKNGMYELNRASDNFTYYARDQLSPLRAAKY